MAKKIVCIDPGHGGKDPGAIGNGLFEKDLTRSITERVAEKLRQYEDVKVILTRHGDMTVSLQERVDIANQLNADFFLSIHVNAGGGTGLESFVYTGAGEHTKGLRTMIHAEIGKYLDAKGIFDRGPKFANFQVLRDTRMPAMLVECLFIDNAKDAALLRRDDILDGLAGAIVAGLVRAFSLVLKQPTWDPQQEVQKLLDAGIINTPREHKTPITWGEFATVLNRILNK